MSRNVSQSDYDVVAYASRPPAEDYSGSHSTPVAPCEGDVCHLSAPCERPVKSERSDRPVSNCAPCGKGCKEPCQCQRCLRIAIWQLRETLRFCQYNRRDRRRNNRKDRRGNEFAGPLGNFYEESGSGNYFNPYFCPRGFTGITPGCKPCKKC